MSTKLQGLRGMNDLLPDEAERWEAFEAIVRDWLKSYGYRPIRTPILEPTALFHRGVGEHTDIVEKEMYSFEDRLSEEKMTLRPEGTASCVRLRRWSRPVRGVAAPPAHFFRSLLKACKTMFASRCRYGVSSMMVLRTSRWR